ncbi:MAG TPA: hypothetical protein VMX13_05045 [Sedimentisphaerales bacterium]|nr:hypothetical protein [Sedimentisphaerales bacterium]
MTRTKELFTLGVVAGCLLFGVAPGTHSGVEASEQELEALIAAVRQARRPCGNMRVRWVVETVKPRMLYFERRNLKMPEQAPAETLDFSTTLSGSRSRIESVQKSYESGDRTKEPSLTQDSIAVFDGERQRRLMQPIKGFSEKLTGWQFYDDKNSSELLVRLWKWPFDLSDAKARERYRFEMVDTDDPKIHIFDAIRRDGWRYRFTVDGSKDFNVTKIECIRTNGEYDWINEYSVSQHPDGRWYMNGWERTRWPFVGEEGEPYVEWRAKVTSVEFDIEVPDETFKLEFPPGTKVYDRVMDDWYTIVSSEHVLVEDHLLDEPLEAAVAARAGPSPNRPEQQESDIPERGGDTTDSKTHPEKPPEGPLAQPPTGRKPVVWCLLVVAIVAVCMAVIYVAVAKRRAKKV